MYKRQGVYKQNMEGKGLPWFKGIITSIEPVSYTHLRYSISSYQAIIFTKWLFFNQKPLPVSYTHLDVYKRQHLMKAESPGPSVGKLVPKVRSTAKILYQIYFVLTVVMLACMILTGCPLFDSINLTFATAGTGGFGVLDSSAAEYGAATQWVMTIFMILFGVNFNVYFLF